MANISIYISDDLKDRMSRVQTNWSDVCRRAIEAELDLLEANGGQPAVETPADTDNWKQIAFDEPLLRKDVVIKPSMSPNYSGTTPKEVAVLSSWIAELHKAVRNTGSGGARVSHLLEGNYPVEVLIPGRSWLSGHMKLEQRIVFSYPASEESLCTQEAEQDPSQVAMEGLWQD